MDGNPLLTSCGQFVNGVLRYMLVPSQVFGYPIPIPASIKFGMLAGNVLEII